MPHLAVHARHSWTLPALALALVACARPGPASAPPPTPEPVAKPAEPEAIALDVHVVSDLRALLEDVQCTATLRWPGGSHEWSWTGDVPPDSSVRVGTAQFVVPEMAGELWFDLTLQHPDAAATNRYASIVAPRRNG